MIGDRDNKKYAILSGLNKYFIAVLESDLQKYEVNRLDDLLYRLNGKFSIQEPHLKQIYDDLKERSKQNSQKNLIKITKQNLIKEKNPQKDLQSTIEKNQLSNQQTFINETTFIQNKILLKSRIVDGKMKVEITVHDIEDKSKQIAVNFVINPSIKVSNLSLQNWKKLTKTKQILNLKQMEQKQISFYTLIQKKEHKFKITQSLNELGSNFLQQYGAIIQANYRQHYRSLKVTLTDI